MKKQKTIDFSILSLRWYLIFYMISYGWSKLTFSQFGVHDPSIIEQPMKSIDSFYVAWHLFARSNFFNIVSGLIEILGAILLLFNRTTIIGALIILSVLVQILIINISFTTGVHGFGLPFRITGMIIADIFILYYYRDRIILAWKNLTGGTSTKFKYKWWIFLLLPIIGFLMDFIFTFLLIPFKLLLYYLTS
ncbi:DoxX family membrane protein [Tenacibaculum jejuense]|uniref:DoxX family protein n=1 Tax=Tenacibaculum jejuense TaxID=584609 RepID=A0A238U6Q5_9FLAO|nr:DoxX family membrane protein [Tenacibaculum jejuense]SNR14686.1 conserved membrane protein of unknown function [Tenacibaculum jejuense]